MEKKKKISLVALILSLISLIPMVVLPSSYNGALVFIIVGLLVGIVAIVLGIIGLKGEKVQAILGIVFGAISSLVLMLSLIGIGAIGQFTDCEDKGDGIAVCSFQGEEMEIPTSLLREDQIKK